MNQDDISVSAHVVRRTTQPWHSLATDDDQSDVHLVRAGDREIWLVGTAHVSQRSVELVREVIERERPDVVCIELDARPLRGALPGEALRRAGSARGDAQETDRHADAEPDPGLVSAAPRPEARRRAGQRAARSRARCGAARDSDRALRSRGARDAPARLEIDLVVAARAAPVGARSEHAREPGRERGGPRTTPQSGRRLRGHERARTHDAGS